MSTRRDNIILELEDEFSIDLDSNFEAGVNGLCDGDTCRHDECECWDTFRKAVERQLIQQEKEADDWEREMQEMHSLYKGEVKAGIHIPASKDEGNADYRGED